MRSRDDLQNGLCFGTNTEASGKIWWVQGYKTFFMQTPPSFGHSEYNRVKAEIWFKTDITADSIQSILNLNNTADSKHGL